ncbi:MAG: CopG family transcriptional regulator [Rickettsiales bacterium]|nr:CopG family transcriptional regulator [Rickettsiales bacterium]
MKTEEIMLENRTARLTILIDPNKKKAFEELCTRLDTTPSQAMRQMVRDFLAKHNVAWTPGDAGADDDK